MCNEKNLGYSIIDFIKGDLQQIMISYKQYKIIYAIILLKFKYKNNIFFYYSSGHENKVELDKHLYYGGFYNIATDTFYGLDFYIKGLLDKKCTMKSITSLSKEINEKISQRATELIDSFNDKNLERKVKLILTEADKKEIEEYKTSYYAYKLAEAAFLEKGEHSKFTITLNVEYRIEDILDYVEQKDKFIEFSSRKYIESYLVSIYKRFIFYMVVDQKYRKIVNDKNNELHLKKSIANSISDQQTVNVTILKDDVEFTFKTTAESLTRGKYSNYYSSYDINAKDRNKFYKTFGRNAYYTANEIIKITYGKKTIYSREAANELM